MKNDLPLLAPIPENPAVIVTPVAQEETMTLSSLFIVCPHGRRSAHGVDDGSWCQGGRPATLEDLGGEIIEWCEQHKGQRFKGYPWCQRAADASQRQQIPACSFVERILIPLPQMVAGESL